MDAVGFLDLMFQFGEIPVDSLEIQQFKVVNTSSDGQVAGEGEDVSPGKRLSEVEVDYLDANSTNHKIMKIIKKQKE